MWICKRKVLKKWASVQDIKNNGYSDARHEKREKRKRREKERKKIANVSSKSIFQVSNKRDMF
jgi:hypothetical protein